jgi:hypothetical protein
MDNAPGHFDAFQRDGIRVVFFPPNCTSWKQPCDMGIIAALKKRCKYLYLNDVLSFYDLEPELKEIKRNAGIRLRRGAAGVDFGNPAHLLDAANYVKASWDAILPQSILNCFKKAEIMDLDAPDLDVASEDADFTSAIQRVSDFNLNEEELNDYLNVDNADNEAFVTEILNEVEDLFVRLDSNELPQDEADEEQFEYDREGVSQEEEMEFAGFNSLYKSLLQLKEQVFLANFGDIDATAEFDGLVNDFDKLESRMRKLIRLERQKQSRSLTQLTLHDYFH